jgi:hypothetical protein
MDDHPERANIDCRSFSHGAHQDAQKSTNRTFAAVIGKIQPVISPYRPVVSGRNGHALCAEPGRMRDRSLLDEVEIDQQSAELVCHVVPADQVAAEAARHGFVAEVRSAVVLLTLRPR